MMKGFDTKIVQNTHQQSRTNSHHARSARSVPRTISRTRFSIYLIHMILATSCSYRIYLLLSCIFLSNSSIHVSAKNHDGDVPLQTPARLVGCIFDRRRFSNPLSLPERNFLEGQVFGTVENFPFPQFQSALDLAVWHLREKLFPELLSSAKSPREEDNAGSTEQEFFPPDDTQGGTHKRQSSSLRTTTAPSTTFNTTSSGSEDSFHALFLDPKASHGFVRYEIQQLVEGDRRDKRAAAFATAHVHTML